MQLTLISILMLSVGTIIGIIFVTSGSSMKNSRQNFKTLGLFRQAFQEIQSSLVFRSGLISNLDGNALLDKKSTRDNLNENFDVDSSIKKLLDEVLEIINLYCGSVKLNFEQLNLKHLVNSIIDSECNRQDIRAKRIIFDCPQDHWVLADKTHLRRCLSSLIFQAAYQSQETIIIRLETQHQTMAAGKSVEVSFHILDDAQSTFKFQSDDFLDFISRKDNPGLSERVPATVSLHLANELATLMNGNIKIYPTTRNGICFCLTFVAISTIPKKQITTNCGERSEQRKPNRAINSKIENKTILIVDDNEINLKVLKALLAQDGFPSIMEAMCGKEAIDIALEKKFDLIFMDIQMPDIDGLAATKEIRRSSVLNKNTPIIAVTAASRLVTEELTKEAGMDGLIHKPVTRKILIEKIRKFGVVCI